MGIVSNKAQIGIRIPKELNERLERYVAKIGISKQAFILVLIFDELGRVGKVPKIKT